MYILLYSGTARSGLRVLRAKMKLTSLLWRRKCSYPPPFPQRWKSCSLAC